MVVVPLGDDGAPIQSGGWKDKVSVENFATLVECWRTQDVSIATPTKSPTPKPKKKK
jgi:hypothetical protein